MLEKISIDTKSKTITFHEKSEKLIFPVEFGKNGIAEINEGIEGDKKTPKGTFKIIEIRTPKENQKEVFHSKNKNISFGPLFILLNAKYKNKIRGIAIHGSKKNQLKPTDGCIRMYNSDLLNIKNKLKINTEVIIN